MSSLNVSVLAYGRDSYLRQLKLHLTPLIYEGLVSLYEDAIKREQEINEFNGNELKQFQKLLCDIPSWNQSILEEETRRILTEVDFLMEMVAAVFVAQVQILASVKLGGNNSKIRVKIPTSDIFVHAVYCKAAETFYYNPYKFQTYHVRESKEYIKEMINKNIDDVIDDMIPIESIIKEYISNVFTAHTKQNPKVVETIEEESPGRILDHNDLGLSNNDNFGGENSTQFDDQFGDHFDTPLNDNFGAGNGTHFGKTLETGLGGDDFTNDIGIGKDPILNSNFDFKDDNTDIFSTSKQFSKEPVFKATEQNEADPFGSESADPFKSESADPFKSESESVADPFKSESESNTDPFKSESVADPFKNDSPNFDDIPTPPELEKDSIFTQPPDQINFFDDIP